MVRALKVLGWYHDSTGYDHHTRSVVGELLRRGIPVELFDPAGGVGTKYSPSDRAAVLDTLRSPTGARTTLHIAMPHIARPEPDGLNVLFTMFEAIPAPADWIARSRFHHRLVVPVEASRQAWLAGGMPEEQIRTCPLGIDAELYGPPAVPLPLRRENGVPIAEYRTRFLNVAAIGSRKNLPGLLRVWMRATTSHDDAVLVLKIGNYFPTDYDYLRGQIREVEQELGKRLADVAPVHAVFDILPVASLPRLYAAATHYFSMSHGEGWDLPMVEAGASGLRLIAPRHSAYEDYLDDSIADLIPSRRVSTTFYGDPYLTSLFAGAEWWDPDEDAAIAYVRAAIDGREPSKASPRQRFLRDLSWQRSVDRLLSIVDEVETEHPEG